MWVLHAAGQKLQHRLAVVAHELVRLHAALEGEAHAYQLPKKYLKNLLSTTGSKVSQNIRKILFESLFCMMEFNGLIFDVS